MISVSKPSIRTFLTLLFIGILCAAFITPVQTDESIKGPHKWLKLGKRDVDFKIDKDVIRVTGKKGRFTKIKIHVKKAPINMHRCIVHFGNGGSQEISIMKNIPAGGKTRVLDLNGGPRVIKKVVFWYDTKNMAGQKARVVLWGKR